MELKGMETTSKQQHTEEWENAPEINEDEFEKIITQLYFLLQRMPKNVKRRCFKDVKISEYKKILNL